MHQELERHGSDHFCTQMCCLEIYPARRTPSWRLLGASHPKREARAVRYYILRSRRVTEEVLGTTFCLVEQALNSRPITPSSTDSRELEALIPNHFLLGQRAPSFPSLSPGEHFDQKKKYVRALSNANGIWSCCLREEVPSLNKRVKLHSHSDSILTAIQNRRSRVGD